MFFRCLGIALVVSLLAVPADAGPVGLFGRHMAAQCRGSGCMADVAPVADTAVSPAVVKAVAPEAARPKISREAWQKQAKVKATIMAAQGKGPLAIQRELIRDAKASGFNWLQLIQFIMELLQKLFPAPTAMFSPPAPEIVDVAVSWSSWLWWLRS